ncbi:transglutaminase domain-containing protein [Candidatus Woesearchaeota archaeon]|nr:transglutaminase domain-containing protein [Candidatus Woesearchaeota archaeon]
MNPLETTPQIRTLATRLTYHLIRGDQQAQAIHAYAAKEIRYEPLYEMRRKYRTASETLEAKAGCCAEKSYLAIALARCAGLDARYVSILLRPAPPNDETQESDEDSDLETKLEPRGHAGVHVHLKDKVIFLETTDTNGYDRRPADDELLSYKEITDDQVTADFVKRNASPEEVIEPLTPKDVIIQAGNEVAITLAKRAMMVCLGAGLTLVYSCVTQPSAFPAAPPPHYLTLDK